MNKEITRLSKLIAKHQDAIYRIQQACQHPKETLVYENKGNTGNYDPSADCYWAEYKCHECGKYWHGDQGEWDGIRKGSVAYQLLMKQQENAST